MGDLPESGSAPPARQGPFREDCWTEEATATLVNAWGRRYLELNRGNLRQKDWMEVANAVNSRHGQTKKAWRTDVQCKNRIDTLKKKYKTEKTKIAESNGTATSSWPFFSRLHVLIGSNSSKHQSKFSSSPAASLSPSPSPPSPPMAVPLSSWKPPSAITPPQKRQRPFQLDASYFKRNYSAIAAAAAVAEHDSDGDEAAGDSEDEEPADGGSHGPADEQDGLKSLAKAIDRIGEIYERVESMKQRQMMELEKERMKFAKELEAQRMNYFMDTQVLMEKIKLAKRARTSDDTYS